MSPATFEHHTVRIAELEAENARLRQQLLNIARGYSALLGAAAAALAGECVDHDDTRAELAGAMRELFRMGGMH